MEKKEDNQLPVFYDNPNKLPIWYVNGFINWMKVRYSIYLGESDVYSIHDYLESAKTIEIQKSFNKEKTYELRDGQIHKFNQAGADFIDAMFDYPAELKIRIMGISASEMEKEISERRVELSEIFRELFNDKRFLYRDTNEPVIWKNVFTDGYYFEENTSPTKIVNSIRKGSMTLDDANKLYDSLTDEIYLPENQKNQTY